MELVVALSIGYTFRAQPLNAHFQQARGQSHDRATSSLPRHPTRHAFPHSRPTTARPVPPPQPARPRPARPSPQVQQIAEELAEQMLPAITTVEVKPEALGGANLIAWRPDLQLGGPSDHAVPATLVVLNPGDEISGDAIEPSLPRHPAAVAPAEGFPPHESQSPQPQPAAAGWVGGVRSRFSHLLSPQRPPAPPPPPPDPCASLASDSRRGGSSREHELVAAARRGDPDVECESPTASQVV